MTTTTLRMPEDLKARVAAAAKRHGTTPYAFILQAIAKKTEPVNLRRSRPIVCPKLVQATCAWPVYAQKLMGCPFIPEYDPWLMAISE